MSRFHVHIAVDDLDRSIAFYSTVLGAEPTVLQSDYAKWQLEDPKVAFAISARGRRPGLDHLGIQVESEAELDATRGRLDAAGLAAVAQENTTCCYARSDKHWTVDPQGIAWEVFHTLDSAPTFGEERAAAGPGTACCAPAMPSCC
jgi:catechol 2,3-dioxygenase-like lactoylglutathione lyase family enzyme